MLTDLAVRKAPCARSRTRSLMAGRGVVRLNREGNLPNAAGGLGSAGTNEGITRWPMGLFAIPRKQAVGEFELVVSFAYFCCALAVRFHFDNQTGQRICAGCYCAWCICVAPTSCRSARTDNYRSGIPRSGATPRRSADGERRTMAETARCR